MESLWWTSWEAIGRTVILGVAGYTGLVLLLRAAGKRATAKMNMFDWAVTVALGSMLATLVLSDELSISVGLTGLATLIGLQFVIAWLHVRSERIRSFLTASPTLLYYGDEYLRDRLRKERISEEDVRSEIRAAGFGSIDEVQAVILEPDAEFSVIAEKVEEPARSLLEDVDVP